MHRLVAFLAVLVGLGAIAHADDRPRLAVLTDIGGDPDDRQSLVRLLAYANEFQIEVLLASAAGTPGDKIEPITRTDLILNTIAAYEKVLPNLERHAENWPSADALRSCVVAGNPHRARTQIDKSQNTAGSQRLVERIDAGSPERPLNIAIWGGQTDLAQALLHVKQTRGAEGLAKFVRLFRVYDIDDQDGLAKWMRSEFPGMTYILAKSWEKRDKREGVYRGMYLTGDESLTSLEWIDKHIRSTGPLGELYPTKAHTDPNPNRCMKEGDTPSRFFFLGRGGNDPTDPSQPGWGGQFERQPDGWYRDFRQTASYDPRHTVSRYRLEFQKDFARRMAWCKKDQ